METIEMSISQGNRKTGAIPSFSLPPGRSCSNKAKRTCFKQGCYAMKSYRLYPTTKTAWDRNFKLAKNHLEDLEDQLMEYFERLNSPKYFRVHVGGDFVSKEYAQMWARIAESAPTTKFLSFTKQWNIIKETVFPDNFQIILSAWPGCKIPKELRDKYRVAWMRDNQSRDIPVTAKECPGYCETCGECWTLTEDVVFNKH